ncbi:MAG TPA: pepsin/retropepsin-like aspartic protease family protein [Candidatus Acidoferrales bacterium]|nr:pepsin/retropepsin-like aspartic protease family protein [Candidatus Acidoferrales bacterium]
MHGTFETWHAPQADRDDEVLGIRTQRTLRAGGVEYVQNDNGDVRVLRGLVERRQRTEDFIDSGDFAKHPESDALLGASRLPDGRSVWMVRVAPPGGEPYAIGLDANTWLVDEKSYQDGDAVATAVYSDYRVVDGALVPFTEVDSSGDRAFDIASHATEVRVDQPIDPAVFAPLQPTVIQTGAAVTVPLLTDNDHIFVRATADGKPLLMLIDTGAQGIFLDPGAAARLGLQPQGMLEVRGAARTSGQGVAALDGISIGGAYLPVHVASVVDLRSVTYDGATVDGVLGYPLFAAAEARIDPEARTLEIARPGTLKPKGAAVPVDTDRELPEAIASVDGVDGRFLLDTGNSNELLIFHHFVSAHPGVITYQNRRNVFAPNSGVGGSSAAVPAMIGELRIGPFRLFNRYTDVMLADAGAFADRNDAGNIGFATLRNFVCTFDLADDAVYLDPTRWFDNGSGRSP